MGLQEELARPARPPPLPFDASLQEEDDEEVRLRIVRSPTESFREADSEDARRRVGKRRRRDTIRDKLRGRRTIFGTLRHHSAEKAEPIKEETTADPEYLPRIGRVRTECHIEEQRAKAESFVCGSGHAPKDAKQSKAPKVQTSQRRSVWLNWDPPETSAGVSTATTYARNKVKTSKYSLLTFLPKNLTEQFRRAANLYFLVLVVLQVFPMFGAAAPQIAMLPLLAVLCMTGFKDALEDWRRHRLDNEVNNSAVTRLGSWRNVNVPISEGGFFSRLFRGRSLPDPRTHISRGVRKLREKEGTYSTDFLYSSTVHLVKPEAVETASIAASENVESLRYDAAYGRSEVSVDSSYTKLTRTRSNRTQATHGAPSERTTKSGAHGVVDYDRKSSSVGGAWERTLWKKLEVGDVVLLREDDQVPADLVILSTSDHDGVCFCETKNLDGETNLKPRRSLRATLSIQSEEDLEQARFVVDSEPAHANLYSYLGVLRYPKTGDVKAVTPSMMSDRLVESEPITINEILLRGTSLRNTSWVIGLVLFTGADTKIMLNQGETPSKRSKIEKETNFNVLANFIILVLICLVCAIANGIFLGRTKTSASFYEPDADISSSYVVDAIITFAACLILFQNIVPISLVISVELVKSIQALFLFFDLEMYYEPLDHPCVPRSWNISDDLGQIAYIFSDKTGTLTQNVMEFQRCSVGGKPYGEGITESMIGAARRDGRDASALDPLQNRAALQESKDTMLTAMKRLFTNQYLWEDKVTLISPDLARDLANASSPQRQRLVDFFRSLALCHTVLAEQNEQDHIEYKAESPDEAALVAGARDAGFVFLSRTTHRLELNVMGRPEIWIPLRVLEFNSTRKRMSVVVRAPDGRILLICKGADSVIYQRLRADHDEDAKKTLNKDLEDFANSGLRTLCIATRMLTENEFEVWSKVYDTACAAIDDREEGIERACELVERDLVLQGATALEDKLQEGVPDCIAALHKAGIKLWVLTGDKLQTAIEIGFAANVLQSSMDTMILSAETIEGLRAQVDQALNKIKAARQSGNESQQYAVVIDGESLRHALEPALKMTFMDLTIRCETVICCRVSPAQKAQTVRLIKEGINAMTLAIGDGANDVAMIQAAHVGVGIAGLEGAQAAMSADYAVGQFRFLQRLLLVHGHWSYTRVAAMHANFFFKSIVWTMASFLVQPWANFDALYLFDVTLILAYNLVFTSLPVLILGAFDQDLPASALMAYPGLYKRGILGLEYTKTIFWIYMWDGCYQGLVCYFIPYFFFASIPTLTSRGFNYGLEEFGTTVAICAVLSANLFVGFNSRYWTWMMFASIFGSILAMFLWLVIIAEVPGGSLWGLLQDLFTTPALWLLMVISQVVAIGPRYVWRYVSEQYWPTDAVIIRERAILLAGQDALDDEAKPSSSGSPKTAIAAASSSPLQGASLAVPSYLMQRRPSEDLELASIASRELVTAPTSPTNFGPHARPTAIRPLDVIF